MRKFLINFSPIILYLLHNLLRFYLQYNYTDDVLIEYYTYSPSAGTLTFVMILYYLWRSPIGKSYGQSLFLILILRFILVYIIDFLNYPYAPFFLIPFDLLLPFFYYKRTQEKYKKGLRDYAKLGLVCLYSILYLFLRYFSFSLNELEDLTAGGTDILYRRYYVFAAIQVICMIFLIIHLIAVYRYKGDGNVREENLIDEIGN